MRCWHLLLALPLLAAFAVQGAEPEGTKHFAAPGFEVIAIEDGKTSMPLSLFSGGEINYKGQSVPASVNVFLVSVGREKILIDGGNGVPRGSLAQKLEALKVKPEEITTILLTHLHNDHTGGLMDADGKAFFSDAELYLSKAEFDSDGGRNRLFAAYRGKVHTFADGAKLPGGFIGRDIAGHTPGHTLYELGDWYFFADLIHGAALQFAQPELCAKYDRDPVKAVAARRRILGEAAAGGKTVAGAHLPFPGVGKVAAAGNGFSFQPL